MSLKAAIKSLIATEGPIPVSTYMTLCLHHPEWGYYATDPGLQRDFTTAPELSQAFGELLGLWAVQEWQAMGAPDPVLLAELGPGRGTLMADAMRAAGRAEGFAEAARLNLVEASPVLRQNQAAALSDYTPAHHDALEGVPAGPALILANEFLDCLPARQFVRDGRQWRERVIGLDEHGELVFGLAADRKPDAPSESAGAEIDLQPALETVVETLAARAAPFRALFVDYGPAEGAPGDTLRAFRGNRQIDPLDTPGKADLTVDVDFPRLVRLARAAGLDVAGPAAQGAFLGALGIEARMRLLIAANPVQAEAIHGAIAMLVEPDKMGARFKAICLSSAGLPPPTGF